MEVQDESPPCSPLLVHFHILSLQYTPLNHYLILSIHFFLGHSLRLLYFPLFMYNLSLHPTSNPSICQTTVVLSASISEPFLSLFHTIFSRSLIFLLSLPHILVSGNLSLSFCYNKAVYPSHTSWWAESAI